MTAREEILAKIRSSLNVQTSDPAAAYVRIHRHYRRIGLLSREDRMALFVDCLTDYEVEILEVNSVDGIAAAIATALHSAKEHTLLAAPSFPRDWLPSDITIVSDDNLSPAAIDDAQAVVTTCEAPGAKLTKGRILGLASRPD